MKSSKDILDYSFTREDLRKARRLAKSEILLYCHVDSEGKIKAALRTSHKNITRIKFNLKDNKPKYDCEICGIHDVPCSHAVLVLSHLAINKAEPIKKNYILERPEYLGIKKELLSELAKPFQIYKSSLKIEFLESLPHAPGKWDGCILDVKLFVAGREYAGNMSNLRQLFFRESPGGILQITHFPPQDCQIIRFLANFAEPAEGAKVMLKAETAVEFFHCLQGFSGISCGGMPLTVHKTPAEPVITYTNIKEDILIRAALSVNDSILLLTRARIITGRAGCWVGIGCDYWWVPALNDLGWIRNFIRVEELKLSPEEASRMLKSFKNNSVRTIEFPGKRTYAKKPIPVYYVNSGKESLMELRVDFNYDDSSIERQNSLIRRDRLAEIEVERELESFGFTKISEHLYILNDIEVVGVFLEEVIPQWISQGKAVFIPANFAYLHKFGNKINRVVFSFEKLDENFGFLKIRYRIKAGGSCIRWKHLLETVRENRRFIMAENGEIGKIDSNLRNFVLAVWDFVSIAGENEEIIIIPSASSLYWDKKAAELLENESLRNTVVSVDNKQKVSVEKINSITEKPELFKGELRNYQKEAVTWIFSMSNKGLNVILADEMGLGKTIQTLALLAELKNNNGQRQNMPSLVLCPSSLVENWEMEAAKFVPSLKTTAVRGPRRNHLWDQIGDSDIVISSYSLFKRDLQIYKGHKFCYVILDEAQHIKNPSTENAKACKSLESSHRIVLTGTPLENSPDDLWSIFDFLHPNMLSSFRNFKIRYSGISENQEKQLDLASRVGPFIIRRRKKEVLSELPPKIEQVIYCEMDNEQRKIYEKLLEKGREDCVTMLKNNSHSRFNMLTSLLRLRQLCCHPQLLPSEFNATNAKSAKAELLYELLLESIDSGNKILVFSQFTSLLKIIREWLNSNQISYEYLDGSTQDRMDRVINFNSRSDIPVFLLSLKAGGSGLNLTSADKVIIYDPWWNPAIEEQASDRTHRIGQNKTVYSIKLVVGNSIEEKILLLHEKKRKMFRSLVENTSFFGKLSNEDIEFLLK